MKLDAMQIDKLKAIDEQLGWYLHDNTPGAREISPTEVAQALSAALAVIGGFCDGCSGSGRTGRTWRGTCAKCGGTGGNHMMPWLRRGEYVRRHQEREYKRGYVEARRYTRQHYMKPVVDALLSPDRNSFDRGWYDGTGAELRRIRRQEEFSR